MDNDAKKIALVSGLAQAVTETCLRPSVAADKREEKAAAKLLAYLLDRKPRPEEIRQALYATVN